MAITATNVLYARKEPTTDSVWLEFHRLGLTTNPRPMDVVFYRDPDATEVAACIPWHHTKSKPDRRHKYQMLNCCRYPLRWLDDLTSPNPESTP